MKILLVVSILVVLSGCNCGGAQGSDTPLPDGGRQSIDGGGAFLCEETNLTTEADYGPPCTSTTQYGQLAMVYYCNDKREVYRGLQCTEDKSLAPLYCTALFHRAGDTWCLNFWWYAKR